MTIKHSLRKVTFACHSIVCECRCVLFIQHMWWFLWFFHEEKEEETGQHALNKRKQVNCGIANSFQLIEHRKRVNRCLTFFFNLSIKNVVSLFFYASESTVNLSILKHFHCLYRLFYSSYLPSPPPLIVRVHTL